MSARKRARRTNVVQQALESETQTSHLESKNEGNSIDLLAQNIVASLTEYQDGSITFLPFSFVRHNRETLAEYSDSDIAERDNFSTSEYTQNYNSLSNALEKALIENKLVLYKLTVKSIIKFNHFTKFIEWGEYLSHIDLSSNNIGSDGLFKLAEALPYLNSLQYLNISSNRIVDRYKSLSNFSGVYNPVPFESFMEALSVHPSIKCVDVTHNYLGGVYDQHTYDNAINRSMLCGYAMGIAKIIQKSLLRNLNIICFDITHNFFPNDKEIAQVLMNCIRDISVPRDLSFNAPLQTLLNRNVTVVSLCGANASFLSRDDFRLSDGPTLDIDMSAKGLVPIDGYLLGAELRLYNFPIELNLSNNVEFSDDGVINFCKTFLGGTAAVATDFKCSMTNNMTNMTPNSPVEGSSFSHCISPPPITVLDLANCDISNRALDPIQSIMNLNHLQSLNIEGNVRLGQSDKNINFRPCSTLKFINLTKITEKPEIFVESSAASTFLGMVATTVQSVKLNHCYLNSTSVFNLKTLLISTNSVSNLVSLSIAGNQLSSTAVDPIIEILNHRKCALQSLFIGENPLCGSRAMSTFSPEPIQRLAAALTTNKTLETLDLSGTDIGARSTAMLMTALVENSALTYLNLSRCNISGFGASHIGESLPLIKGLKTLNISHNNIGIIGCMDLFQGLEFNASIEHLNISNNDLMAIPHDADNANEFRAMTSCIANNKTLKSLDLSFMSLFGVTTTRVEEETLSSEFLSDFARSIALNNDGCSPGNLEEIILYGNRIPGCRSDCSWLRSPIPWAPRYGIDIKSVPEALQLTCSSCSWSVAVNSLISARRKHRSLKNFFQLRHDAAFKQQLQCCIDDSCYLKNSKVDQTIPAVQLACEELLCRPSMRTATFYLPFCHDSALHQIVRAIENHYYLSKCNISFLRPDYVGLSSECRKESEVTKIISRAKMISFEKRMVLIEFIRSCRHLQTDVILPVMVIEYLFGETEEVTKHFKKYI